MAVSPVITEELLRRFDVAGPRYTSYPTADRFTPSFGETDLLAALRGIASSAAPMSLYVHIPFCESVCYYCACNKIVTRQHGRAAEYLDALEREAREPPVGICEEDFVGTRSALR